MGKTLLKTLCLMLIGIFTVGSAAANCGGKNRWPEFAQKHPQAAQAAEALARDMPFGQGRLFRLSKPDLPVSYVLGTIHIPDARYLPLSGQILQAFNASKVTLLELNTVKEAGLVALAEKQAPEYVKAFFAEAGQRPADFLSAEEQMQVNTIGVKVGSPGPFLLSMRPALLAMSLSLAACPEAGTVEKGVDGELERLSLQNTKLVLGLETLFEQLGTLNDLPFDVQKEVLHQALRFVDKTPDTLETLKQLYIEGRLGLILLGMQGKIPEFTAAGEPGPPAYITALLDDRNRRMVQRARPLLEVNSTFLAVGAAHLPGETGILKLLQDAGYKVEKVE